MPTGGFSGYSGNIISVTPTITAGAYGALDAVGGLLTFADAALGGTNLCEILGVTIVDKADQKAALQLLLFKATITATADNSPWPTTNPTAAVVGTHFIGKVSVAAADYFDGNAVAVAHAQCRVLAKLSGTSLFGQLVCTGTPTYAAVDDLIVSVHVLQH